MLLLWICGPGVNWWIGTLERVSRCAGHGRMCLALDLAVDKLPDWARDGIHVRDGVEVAILERLNNGSTSLRVVASVDRSIGAVVDVVGNGDRRWQIELRVQSAGAVAELNGRRGREFVDVVRAGGGAVQALLNAVAFTLDLREGQVDLSDDTCHVEATGVSNAAMVHGSQVRADTPEATLIIVIIAIIVIVAAVTIVANAERASKGTDGKEGNKESSGEMHLVVWKRARPERSKDWQVCFCVAKRELIGSKFALDRERLKGNRERESKENIVCCK